MRIHQLLLPLVSEADEHVLGGTLQPLAVVSHEPEKAVNIDVILEVDGQYVPHIRPWPTLRLARMAKRLDED